jgi:hypothetical protein
MIIIHIVLVLSLLCEGWRRAAAPDKIIVRRMPADKVVPAGNNGENTQYNAAPAVKGSANPANSLSAVISLLFFAKLAINLLTLQGYNVKSKIYYKTHSI